MQRIHVTIRPLNREDSVLYFPPEAFGPFRVLHQIGAGTLGPVFRAYEPGRDRLVAVKVFRLDLTPEQSEGLAAELRALVAADISHPNIAAPITTGMEHGAVFLAQEYAVGDSLDVVLRERGPMTIQDVVALVDSLAGAIDHAAGRGIHHGLLHPRDIVVAADAVRITGFGIAGALAKIGAKLPTRPQYSSPDAASDVYSLGAIAFEAATGKRASEDNLRDFKAAHGATLAAAFGLPLTTDPDVRPARAGAYAEVLSDATGFRSAPVAPHAPVAPIDPVAPNAPSAPNAPNTPNTPIDPLDRVIELGASRGLDLDVPDFVADVRPAPVEAYDSIDIEPEPTSRRWPIVAMFLAFAVLIAIAVGFFLQAPRPTPPTDSSVDSTVVDVPASAPSSSSATAGKPAGSAASSPNATAGKPAARVPPDARDARNAPSAPNAPGAPNTANARNASGALSARRPPAPSPSRPASGAVQRVQSGSVLIRTTPADADVIVNGKPRGKTPLALRDLALGSYTIRVARDGYEPEERTLQITAQRPTASTTIDLREVKTGPGGLNVQSRPAGARVFVNDRLAGSTPIAIPGLPAGPATVRIELDGHQTWTTTVNVVAGEQTRVGASLEEK